ncbi:PP2C family protein-serine/threonine phosphatase [Haliangium sp.]|uniref:PP2C family protein-serine/threonine phosphatase n=1 Tax=Haliangium sp. TaxID=2663208 RepID=UPI003D13DC4E
MHASEATDEPGVSQPGRIVVETRGLSDVGCVRSENQDGFLIGDLSRGRILAAGGTLAHLDGADSGDGATAVDGPGYEAGPRGLLWVVCDGMGGAAAGEVASELAGRMVWDEMHRAQATTERVVYGRRLRRAVRMANLQVWDEGRRRPQLKGMGTTLSAAGLMGSVVIMAQIGDSRAYVARGAHLVQVTRDQSVGAALVQSGRMTPEEVRDTPHAHTVLQALGIRDDVEVALSIVRIRRGDRLLLCSDGLYGPLGDALLLHILRTHADVDRAAAALVAAARAAGGPDNITAVLVRFDGEGLREARDDEPPRFVEMDPMEEGDRAMIDTARVARRLAAQFGLDEDPGPPVVPATGQYLAQRGPRQPRYQVTSSTDAESTDAESTDAESMRAETSGPRMAPLLWIAAVVMAVTVATWLAWDYLWTP